MELSRYSELFLAESRERISELNHLLLALESDPAGREPVEGVFRAVHTIKGMAATMGYGAVAELAHEMENLLDALRRGGQVADATLVDLLLDGADALESAIGLAVAGRREDFDFGSLIARFRGAATRSPPCGAGNGHRRGPNGASPGVASLRVRVIVGRDAPLPGSRAFLALRRARELGEAAAVEPPEDTLVQEEFAGELHFVLRTDREAGEVREALWAVGELEQVVVEPHEDARSPATEDEVFPPESLPGPEPAANGRTVSTLRHIRVDLRRLDLLMDQVGELAILQDGLQRVAATHGTPELAETVDQAGRLVSDLRDGVMRARMVPVWQVFDRFPRLVRDAAQTLGKRVDLVIEGKEIEFDRSMLDELSDAVVHLLRNAVDHGIEPPDERQRVGKPEAGVLRLHASRERNRAVIRVEDDGRGIDRARIRETAAARGVTSPEQAATLQGNEVLALLTRPGFSTAARVTDVSGRGVGLDVVATRVRSLGGALEIATTEGAGSCFTLRLPLTLAVVRALLVRAGDDVYAIPLLHVSEAAEFFPGQIRSVAGRAVVHLRDEVVPVLSLRAILGYPSRAASPAPVAVVMIEAGKQIVGLEVDALAGQKEIVVKSFDGAADALRVFSGATILSDGRPALILDAANLLKGGAPC